MNRFAWAVATMLVFAAAVMGQANPAPANTSGAANSDLYHVYFAKAAVGQAKALEAQVKAPSPNDPMPGHMLVLRHEEGDDWDYVVITHLGAKFTIDPSKYSAPTGAAAMAGAWHTDTIVAGPSWDVFMREMGMTANAKPGAVYVVTPWRAAPGKRNDLLQNLSQATPSDAKFQMGHVILTHVEGGPWQFLAVQKFNSWQDFGAYEAATQDDQAWYSIRDVSTWHHDTLASRIDTGAMQPSAK